MRRVLIWLVMAVGVLAGCSDDGIGGVTLVTSGQHSVGAVRLLGDVVLLDGTLELDEGATVAGSVHVLGGLARIAGQVEGDVTLVGGEVRLGAGSVVHGDISVSAGGVLDLDDRATIRGSLNRGLAVDVAGGAGGFDPLSFLLRTSLLALAIAAVRQLAPRRTRLIASWAGRLPAASSAYGVLVGLVGLSLAVFMAFTIVLAPVALVVLALLGVGVLLGLAGVAAAIDDRVGSKRRWPGLGTILCAVVLNLAPLLPVAGILATLLMAAVALGATGLSLRGSSVRASGVESN